MSAINIIYCYINSVFILILCTWAYLSYKENKKYINQNKKFIEEKKRAWNYFVNELLQEHKGTEMEKYVLDHFKKFKELQYKNNAPNT